MRHRRAVAKLGRKASSRRALRRSLVQALFRHERIVTTVARAKAIRPFAERLVTLAKPAKQTNAVTRLHHMRHALAFLQDKELVRKLFEKIGPRFADRPGGYTRILRLGGARCAGEAQWAANRLGDNGPRALFEFVVRETEEAAPSGKPGAKGEKGAAPAGKKESKKAKAGAK